MDRWNTTRAAQYLDMPTATLTYWRAQGTGPTWYKLGRRVMYDRADLDRFVEESKRASTAVAK